jgi:type I restriction enzyme R subunit
MPHAYSEDQLVEQPVIGLFAELGWRTVSALEETFGVTGTLLLETKGEVVLVSRFRTALERSNASRMGHLAMPPEAVTPAVDELTRDRSTMNLE